jgi:HNH endonuclease
MAEFRLNRSQKQFILQRSHYCCEYCISQTKYSSVTFSIEHTIPRSKGGTNDLENLAIACQSYNNSKYTHIEAIDPITGQFAPLYNPRRDRWQSHFCWSDDYTLIIGLTPTGRATIDRLNLNREGVIDLRQVLHSLSKHPPDYFR